MIVGTTSSAAHEHVNVTGRRPAIDAQSLDHCNPTTWPFPHGDTL
jgi:hypothetical protein